MQYVNLSNRFMKKTPSGYCDISKYAISNVYDNEHGLVVPESIWNNLFKMDEMNGIFEIISFKNIYSNYLVYFKVYNSKIWSDPNYQYLIDISLYQDDSD